MEYLIIGGCGFIGTNLTKKLIDDGKRVTVIDNLSRKGTKKLQKLFIKKKNYSFFKIDVSDKKDVENFFKKKKFNYIYLLAGQVAVTTSITNPKLDFNSNILGCFNVLESIRKYSPNSVLIYSSTNKVYGGLEEVKIIKEKKQYNFSNIRKGINENFSLNFASPYGCSKGAADLYCLDYAKTFNLKTIVLRQSCIYGRYQLGVEDQGWMAWMIIASMFDKKIKIYGDGFQTRDALFVDDLVDAYLMCKDKKKCYGKAYNIGGGIKNKISVIELINFLKDNLNKKTKYAYNGWRKSDQKVFFSDNSKAFKDFKWYPKTKLKDGLFKSISWMKENKNIILS